MATRSAQPAKSDSASVIGRFPGKLLTVDRQRDHIR
jgi:hypothetical protein